MKSFEIIKNKPIPNKGSNRGGLRSVLLLMEIGDCVKVADDVKKNIGGWISGYNDRKFSQRRLDDGIYVWRIE